MAFRGRSDLYLSAFIIVRCSLKVFPLFLEQNSGPLTDQCWFLVWPLEAEATWMFFGSGCFSYSQYA